MVNCALMGADWTRLNFATYSAMLAEWNLRHSDDKAPPPIDPEGSERMRRAMAAASIH